MVIDDFLNNAEALRNTAQGLTYPDQSGAFPGRNSAERMQIEGLDQAVSQLVGEQLVTCGRGVSHGKFCLTLAQDEGNGDIDIDPQAHWSGILYLTPAEHCSGGTDFFRHKASGWDRAPIKKDELSHFGLSSFEELYTKLLAEEGTDRTKWEHLMRVPMRFNRLVLLRPWLWHTAGPGFGTRFADGRLVYLMFFRRA